MPIEDTRKIAFCQQCGHEVLQNAKFCSGCGIELQQSEVPPADSISPIASSTLDSKIPAAPQFIFHDSPTSDFAATERIQRIERERTERLKQRKSGYNQAKLGFVLLIVPFLLVLAINPSKYPESPFLAPLGYAMLAGRFLVAVGSYNIAQSKGRNVYLPAVVGFIAPPLGFACAHFTTEMPVS